MSDNCHTQDARDSSDPRQAGFDCDTSGAALPPRTSAPTDQRIPAPQETVDAVPAIGRTVCGTEGPGTKIGRYILLQALGEGGFGSVFLAEQTNPVRRRVALKVIKPGMDTRQVIARFEAERQALAMMDHPSIARVFDAGATDSGRPYFVMELVQGVPLTMYCDQKMLNIDQRLELFVTICHAVQHAHQKGIIHRDLKPSNILVSEADGNPVSKVIDFGIAKAISGQLSEHPGLTIQHRMMGTPLYMSPEQSEGSADVDTRTDIYSLGVILYELLTGSTPLGLLERMSHSEDQIQRMIREVDAPKPSIQVTRLGDRLAPAAASRCADPARLPRQLRGDLDWITMKCLEKERERRFDSVASLLQDVRHYMNDEPILARPASRLYRARKFVRKHSVAVAAASGIVLALTVGLGIATYGLARAGKALQTANQARAEESRQRGAADQARAQAELRLADSFISIGDASGIAGEWGDAFNQYDQASELLSRLDAPTNRLDFSLFKADLSSPPPLLTLRAHTDSVYEVAVSPDGRRVVSAGADGALCVWDLPTGALLHTLRGHEGAVNCVACGTGGYALSGGADGTIKLWDIERGILLHSAVAHEEGVYEVAVSSDGIRALSGGADNTMKLWNLADLAITRVFSGHEYLVHSVAFLPEAGGASADDDGKIILWNLQTGQRLKTLTGNNRIMRLAVSPDGATILAASHDGTVVSWDLKTAKELGTFWGHNSYVNDVAWVGRTSQALSVSDDGTLRAWDVTTNKELRRWSARGDNVVNSVAVTPDGQLAVTAHPDGSIKLWSLNAQTEVLDVPQEGWVESLAFGGDSRWVAIGSSSVGIKFWDLDTKSSCTLNTSAPAGPLWLSRDGRTLLVAGTAIAVVELPSGRTMQILRGHAAAKVNSLDVTADEKTALSGDDGGMLRLWNLSDGRELRSWQAHDSYITSVCIAPDKRTAISSGDGNLMKLWDLNDGHLLKAFDNQTETVWAARISPDGRTALCANEDHALRLWDLATGKEIQTFPVKENQPGHVGAVRCVAFSADGKLAASGATDKTVRVWEVATGRLLATLSGHNNDVMSVAFSPDGSRIISGSGGLVKSWEIAHPRIYREYATRLQAAQTALQRNQNDPDGLAVLGRWYALRGMWPWSLELLKRARAGGAQVSDAELGACYMHVNDFPAALRALRQAKANKQLAEPLASLWINGISQTLVTTAPTTRDSGGATTSPTGTTRPSTTQPSAGTNHQSN